jgi:tetratricopeptide (TPR) repeat protein
MAEIALRSYLEEIDRLIDGNQVDEAIAHAKHIITIYPMCLEAYRLLAKALLEKNRHIDAADVFQRVLSSVPDDFVSHVGMAIVREDEGSFDAAIWHMERAFEAQPANTPIQDELKRLYARRDGMEPPKIRLTRAALARLYERGDHYPQAIAELQTALAEEPERFDLKVLMAQTLWRARKRAEAAETSAKLLEALPFCREANRILATIWQETGRKAESHLYRKKLEALDPYEAYADPAENGHGALNTPADAVRIPRLDYIAPTDLESSRPDWMQALGLQFEQPAQAAQTAEAQPAATDVPDWLAGFDNAAPAETTSQGKPSGGTDWLTALSGGQAPAPAEPELEATPADVPDWLKPPPGTGELAQPPQDDWLNTIGEAPAAETTPAELPAWLSESAPAETASSGGTDWLNKLFGEPTEQAAETTEPPAAPASEGELPAELPAWLQPEAPAESGHRPPLTGAMDDSLRATSAQAPVPEAVQPPEPTGAPADAESEIPEWMVAAGWSLRDPSKPLDEGPMELEAELEPEAPVEETEAAAPAEMPEWLQSLKPPEEAAPRQATEATPAEAPAETPAWLHNIMESSSGAPSDRQPAPATEEAPDWLTAAAPVSEAAPAEAASPTELPEWLRAAGANPNDTVATFLQKQPVESRPSDTTPGVPDWMKAEEGEAQPASTSEAEELPEWLRPAIEPPPAQRELDTGELFLQRLETGGPDQLPPSETAPIPAPAAEAEELPEWLRPAIEPPPKQRKLDTGELFLQRLETGRPDQLPPSETAPVPAPPTEPEPSLPPLDNADEALAWLESLALKHGAKEEELVSKPEARKAQTPAEIPAWLRQPAEEQPAQSAEPPASAPEAETPAEIPAWLRQPAEEAEPEATIPDWLRQPAEASSDLPPVQAAALPADISEDDALAWLESLALKHGAKEEELVSKPEARAAEPPAWLRQPPEAEEPMAQPEAFAPSETPAETPAWLRQPAEEAIESQPAEEAGPEPAAIPDWLRQPAEAPTGLPPVQATASPADMSEDDALAWLESLALKQGAKEEELVSKPEARLAMDALRAVAPTEAAQPESEVPAEVPAWLRPQAPAEPELAVTDWLSKSAPPPAEPPAVEKPDWLRQMEAEADEYEAQSKGETLDAGPATKEELPPPVALPAAEKPDWLKQMEAEADEYEAQSKAEPATVTSTEDEASAWLEALAAKQGAEEEPAPQVAMPAELPAWLREEVAEEETKADVEALPAEPAGTPEETMRDWLRQPPEAMKTILPEWARQAQEAEAQPAVPATPETPVPAMSSSEDEALAWLESLAARQGAKEEELVTRPEDRGAEMPDWIRAKTAVLSEGLEAGPPQPPAEPEPEPEPVLPTIADWVSVNKLPVPEEAAPVATRAATAPQAAEPALAPRPKAKPRKPSKAPRRPRRARAKLPEEPPIMLAVARERLMEENFGQAIEVYAELTHAGEMLPDVIADLEAANQKHQRMPELLRALGDVYMKDNQLQHALDMYRLALQTL